MLKDNNTNTYLTEFRSIPCIFVKIADVWTLSNSLVITRYAAIRQNYVAISLQIDFEYIENTLGNILWKFGVKVIQGHWPMIPQFGRFLT